MRMMQSSQARASNEDEGCEARCVMGEPVESSLRSLRALKSHNRSMPSSPLLASRLLPLSGASPVTMPSCAGRN